MIEHMKKTKAGFTLVELIVVIAILAILSGIAIPVYSGYISKANEAGDLQLLGALNTAYTAACAEMGLDPTKVVGLATLSGETGSKTVSNVTASGSGAVALSGSSEEFFDAFKRYYGDNIKTPFKTYSYLAYDQENGVFNGGAMTVSTDADGNITFTVTQNGKTITYTATAEQLEAIKNSTFGTAMSMGELMGQVGNVVDAANNVAVLHGIDIASLLGNELISTLGIEKKEDGTYDQTELSNALVLMVAKDTAGLGLGLDEYGNITFENSLSGNEVQKRQLMAQAALSYALSTAFVNTAESENCTVMLYNEETGEPYFMSVRDYYNQVTSNLDSAEGGTKATMDVLSMYSTLQSFSCSPENAALVQKMLRADVTGETLTDEEYEIAYSIIGGYSTYLGIDTPMNNYISAAGQNDIEAYEQALSVITNNDSNLREAGILSNGFNDPEMVAILTSIFGN